MPDLSTALHPVIGLVGVGKLGQAVGRRLISGGFRVVCCARGRSDELVEHGGSIAGDGTARAVAESCDLLLTCLPPRGFVAAMEGPDGVLAASAPLPLVVVLGTAPVELKHRIRARMVDGGSDLLDCPVSGTPSMVDTGDAIIYASGDIASYARIADVLTVIAPRQAYVGEFGSGTKMKYVANLLAQVHVTAAAEAMALAQALDLDLPRVAELISASPGAVSGQFRIRAPLIAAARFDDAMVTVRDSRDVLHQVTSAAREVGIRAPLAQTAQDLMDEFGELGEDDSDPAKLVQLFTNGSVAARPVARPPQSSSNRLYVAIARVTDPSAGAPSAEARDDHLDWINGLEAQGRVFAAGPMVTDDDTIRGDGVFIVRAASLPEAEALLAGDPLCRSGYRSCEVFGWQPHQGSAVRSRSDPEEGAAAR